LNVQATAGEMVEIDQIGTSYGRVRCLMPRQIEQMKASLTAHGQLTALVVVRRSSGLELIDGFKRRRAANEMGWRRLRVTPMDLDEPGTVGGDVGLEPRDARDDGVGGGSGVARDGRDGHDADADWRDCESGTRAGCRDASA
jgi:hypothetical protein